MIRRLLLLCALVALANESAYGVGLGKLELHSALNQRLDADIPLTNTQGLGDDEILPGLASSDEFDKIGLDRPYQLTDLRFAVKKSKDGQMMVHISSTKPVVEPFLDFLVEVLWPNGRILREYTVLLDPPVFGKGGVEALNAPSTGTMTSTSQQASNRQKPTTTTSSSVSVPTISSNRMEQGTATNGQYGVTGPGDTLWKIALKVRQDRSVSVQQTMLAIKRANPDAFINDNINLLKAGRVLRIPDTADIREVSQSSAIDQVKAQNEAFQEYKSGGQVTQLDASKRSGQNRTASSKGEGGELRLLASDNKGGNANSGKGGDAGAASQELQDQLAASKEDLDKAKRANTDLSGKVADLGDQIKTLNNLVKLKDDQLAALKAQVQKMEAEQVSTPNVNTVTTTRSQGSLLTNPYVLIGLGVLLVAGLAGGLIFMRRRGQDRGLDEVEYVDHSLPEDEEIEEEDDVPAMVTEADEEEVLSPQTSDAIGEAEIYIAYGRFPQAITFLQNAIKAEPNRADIRLKLLEVFVETEDATAFNLQFAELAALGDANAISRARALQQKIPGAVEAARDEMPGPAATENDDDLSFDLDDLDAETEEDAVKLELDDNADLDLDLDTDDDAEPEISLEDTDLDLDLAADSSDGEDELGDLDLEIDLEGDDTDDDGAITLDETELEGADLDLDLEAAAAETESDDDDDAISLDLDDDIDLDKELDLSGDLDLDDDDALDLSGELNLDDDDGLELNLDEDASTKLDLARAYIDMGDSDGARSVLNEVIEEGSDSEIQEANELLTKIG